MKTLSNGFITVKIYFFYIGKGKSSCMTQKKQGFFEQNTPWSWYPFQCETMSHSHNGGIPPYSAATNKEKWRVSNCSLWRSSCDVDNAICEPNDGVNRIPSPYFFHIRGVSYQKMLVCHFLIITLFMSVLYCIKFDTFALNTKNRMKREQ